MSRKTILCSRCQYSKVTPNSETHCQGTGVPYEILQAHIEASASAAREKTEADKRRAFEWYRRLFYKFMSKCIDGQLEWTVAEKHEAEEEYYRRYKHGRWSKKEENP